MRRISTDWVIRHNRRFLQLQPGQRRYGPTKSKALVCESEDGTMEMRYRGERIGFEELKELPKKISTPVAPVGRAILAKKEAKKDHPWRQGYKHITPWVPNRAIASATRWDAHLRFALTTGLRFSAHPNDHINLKRGHF